ncbi:hypothetical protein KUTeg_014719 [Tegillarca granosa]|uniref:SMP-30/Gluconolactonase/LRE-like region domain-containing protein n=1 Tax=Tegillarca granosa TaxID=220873 RepID=A0ABQ9ERT3_TEGGR|nr:hypothetical protein KUTeg_014719 [Tegillarca granosa]
MNGSLMFSYLNDNVCFADGRGISVDKDGNIYCCSYRSNNIHQLTPDGQFIKLIVRDITLPYGIAFDRTGKRFLVTHDAVYVLSRSGVTCISYVIVPNFKFLYHWIHAFTTIKLQASATCYMHVPQVTTDDK